MPNENLNLDINTSFNGQGALTAANRLSAAFLDNEKTVTKFSNASRESVESLLEVAGSQEAITISQQASIKLSALLDAARQKTGAITERYARIHNVAAESIVNVNRRTAQLTLNLRAIDAATQTSADATEKFGLAISRISVVSGRSRADISKFATSLIKLGESEQQTANVLIAASNISLKSGQEFNKVAQDILNTYSGTTTELDRIGVLTQEYTKSQLRAGAAVRDINKNFGGVVEQQRTIGNLWRRLTNSISVVFDIIADAFAKNETLFTSAAAFVEDMVVGIGAFALGVIESGVAFEKTRKVVFAIVSFIDGLIGGLLLIPRTLITGFRTLEAGLRTYNNFLTQTLLKLQRFFGKISEEDFLKESAKSAKSMEDSFDRLAKSATRTQNAFLNNPFAGANTDVNDSARDRVQKALDDMLSKLSTEEDFNKSKDKDDKANNKLVASLGNNIILRLLDLNEEYKNFQRDFAKTNTDLINGVDKLEFPLSKFESIQSTAIANGLADNADSLNVIFTKQFDKETAAFNKAQAKALMTRNAASQAIIEEIKSNAADQATLTTEEAKSARQFESDLTLKRLGFTRDSADRTIAANRETFDKNTQNLGDRFQDRIDRLADLAVQADKNRQDEAKQREEADKKATMALEEQYKVIGGFIQLAATAIADTSEEDAKAIADINKTANEAVMSAQETANNTLQSQQEAIVKAQETNAKTITDIEKKRDDALAAADLKREDFLRKALQSARSGSGGDPAKVRAAFNEAVLQADRARTKAIEVAQDSFAKSQETLNQSVITAQEGIRKAEEMRLQTSTEAQEEARKNVEEYQAGVDEAASEGGEKFTDAAISAFAKDAVKELNPVLGALVDPIIALLNGSPEKIDAFIDGIVEGAVKFITAIGQRAPKIITTLIKRLIEALPELIENATTAFIDSIPVIVEAVVGLVPLIIDAFVKFMIEGVPRIAESLAKAIGFGIIGLINTIIGHLNNLPFVNLATIPIPGDEAGAQSADAVGSGTSIVGAGAGNTSAVTETRVPFSMPDVDTLNNTEALKELTDTVIENSAETKKNTDSKVNPFELPSQSLSGFISSGQAFNPFLDPGLIVDPNQQKEPVQLVIRVGNKSLADLFLDLQESGYTREVVV